MINATYPLLKIQIVGANLVLMKETDKLQEEFLKMLGNRIREIRIQKGLSQSEVANRCGKERQSYQRVETGNINPTIWYLEHLAQALGVSLSELVNIPSTKQVN